MVYSYKCFFNSGITLCVRYKSIEMFLGRINIRMCGTRFLLYRVAHYEFVFRSYQTIYVYFTFGIAIVTQTS